VGLSYRRESRSGVTLTLTATVNDPQEIPPSIELNVVIELKMVPASMKRTREGASVLTQVLSEE